MFMVIGPNPTYSCPANPTFFKLSNWMMEQKNTEVNGNEYGNYWIEVNGEDCFMGKKVRKTNCGGNKRLAVLLKYWIESRNN